MEVEPGWCTSMVEHQPMNQISLIPCQYTRLGYRLNPWWGVYRRQLINDSLIISIFSLPLPSSETNKNVFLNRSGGQNINTIMSDPFSQ